MTYPGILRLTLVWILALVCISRTRGQTSRAFNLLRTYNTQTCAKSRIAIDVRECFSNPQVSHRECEIPAQQSRAHFDNARRRSAGTQGGSNDRRGQSGGRPGQSGGTGRPGQDGNRPGSNSQRPVPKPAAVADSRAYTPRIEDTNMRCKLEERPSNRIIEWNGRQLCCRGKINVCYGHCESYSWVNTDDEGNNALSRMSVTCMDMGMKMRWVFFECTNGCHFWAKVVEPVHCACAGSEMRPGYNGNE